MSKQIGNAVGIKQIAEKLGLSPGTISIVLNGRGNKMRISQATQKVILDTAREMNYLPNINAKRLRDQSNGYVPSIGVFWPIGSNPILLERFFNGLQRMEAYQNHSVEIALVPYQNGLISTYILGLNKNFYSGAIFLGLLEEDIEELRQHVHTNIPIVLFNRHLEGFNSVNVDDFEVGYKVAKLFAERGHKRATVIASDKMSRSSTLKVSGFASACLEKGIAFDINKLIREKANYMGGESAALQIIQQPELFPTAIFFQESSQAIGALKVFHQHHIRIPEELEIVSYGDNPQDAFSIPSLTSLRMPLEDMSYDCLDIILKCLRSNQTTLTDTIHECSFVFRESCRDSSSKWNNNQSDTV